MARNIMMLVAFIALMAAPSAQASAPGRRLQQSAPAPASGGMFDSLLAQGKQMAQDAVMKQVNNTLNKGEAPRG